MKVREILRIKGSVLFTAMPQQTLDGAVEVMANHDVGSLVVMGGGKMVGMLTFREVLKAVASRATNFCGGALDQVKVEEVMIRNPAFATPDMDVNDLRRLMIDQHQRYLPVMDGELLMGVVSFLDVAKSVLEEQSFENKMLKNYIKNWPEGDGGAAA
ncbi:CBS domain-containing protein [Oryzomicrobium sp.]|uniref:CBS domain-containing protein n=1 Tax=Oryzomicrobium sp. TaxID=1911578 RepID=UPI0025F6ABEA|nr:CBS domain-containing protein [Oryzomicrobium sp.]MCE1244276.1 CBS domain-containing protein [Oryzomicrobium sp.]